MLVDDLLQKYLGDPFNWWSSRSYPSEFVIRKLIADLEEANITSPNDYYIMHCLSDSYFILGDYKKALQVCPLPEYKHKWSLLANRRINLKVLVGEKCSARELLPLFSKQITKYGLQNIDLIATCFNILLDGWEEDTGTNLIIYTIGKYPCYKEKYFLYNGTFYRKEALNNVSSYSFYTIDSLESFIRDLTRKAENIVREEKGLPRVGEGWLSETKLFQEIRDYLSGHEVIHHGSPPWLGRQHLDIFVPEFNLAIEYQGSQHDNPIDYFGGEQAFEELKRRDKRKENLCRRHGVKIFYVREGYDIKKLKTQIDQYIGISKLNCEIYLIKKK